MKQNDCEVTVGCPLKSQDPIERAYFSARQAMVVALAKRRKLAVRTEIVKDYAYAYVRGSLAAITKLLTLLSRDYNLVGLSVDAPTKAIYEQLEKEFGNEYMIFNTEAAMELFR